MEESLFYLMYLMIKDSSRPVFLSGKMNMNVREIFFKTAGKMKVKNKERRRAYHLAEKSGWGVESIIVSDLPVYCRIATSVTV